MKNFGRAALLLLVGLTILAPAAFARDVLLLVVDGLSPPLMVFQVEETRVFDFVIFDARVSAPLTVRMQTFEISAGMPMAFLRQAAELNNTNDDKTVDTVELFKYFAEPNIVYGPTSELAELSVFSDRPHFRPSPRLT